MSNHKITSRRQMLKTGFAAAAAGAIGAPDARADVPYPEPKKPGEIKIVSAQGHDYRNESGLRPIASRIKNARTWYARHYGPITPELLSDTDLLITYYAGDSYEWSPSGVSDQAGSNRAHLYNPDNVKAIKDNVVNRGMGWLAIHNTPWFVGDELNELLGATCILHREIQPVVVCRLNQNHPITKGIEPFVINLEEQFGLHLYDPDDPNIEVLFRGHGVHDKRWTIQGLAAKRGKGRIVTFTPGHYEWMWYNEACQELIWRSAHWALNLPIEPFYGNYNDFIW